MTDELADAFLTASRALVGLAVRSVAAGSVEVTVPQHRALVLLAGHGSLSIGSLAEELGVNQSNASRQCDRLERLGLVRREQSAADARVVQVGLTAAGRRLVDEVTAWRRAELERVLAAMGPVDGSALVEGLRAFAAAAHELDDRDWPKGG